MKTNTIIYLKHQELVKIDHRLHRMSVKLPGDLRVLDPEPTNRRPTERYGAVDVVISSSGRARQQIAHGRAHVGGARDRRGKSLVFECDGWIDLDEPAVVRRSKRAVLDSDRHVGADQAAAE